MAKISTLTDNFDAGITGWANTVAGGSITADTGGLRITHAAVADFPNSDRVGSWDLMDSAAFVEVRDYGNQSLAMHQVNFVITSNIDTTDQLYFLIEQNLLKAYRVVDNTYTAAGTFIALNTTAHRWLRIREASGTLFWDTSPDSVTWTNRYSIASSISWADVHPTLSCNATATGTASYAVFDNFNTAAVVVATAGSFFFAGGKSQLVGTPVTPPPPGPSARPFITLGEFLHDGGQEATWQNTDLGIPAASFRGILTTNETNFFNAHHPTVNYFNLPQDLVTPNLIIEVNHPQWANDPNYRTTIVALTATYGPETYLHMACEYDMDPPNLYWAQNRFSEIGSTSGTYPPPSATRQATYDQFRHYYLDNNHGGNNNHQQLGQILNTPASTRGYKVTCVNVFAGHVHYSGEMGYDLVFLERNNDDIDGLVGAVALCRGSSVQYGHKWGIDISPWRSGWNGGQVTSYSGSTLIGGWSASTYRRHFYLTYFSGADQMFYEGVSLTAGGTVNYNGRSYIPTATEYKNFHDFAFTRHPQRGIPHAPVAVMKDHNSGWNLLAGRYHQARNVWYYQLTANAGEHMMFNLWDWMYPNYNTWGSSTTTTEPWGSGRWGEQFDVITEKVSATPLQNYPAVLVAMNTVLNSTLQAKLDTYARAGGIVIINARQLTGTAHETLTGVHLTGSASTSGTVSWDGSPVDTITGEPTFNYSTCTLGTATNLAHTGTSTTQVARNVLGSGEVWTVMPDWMSNAANTALLGLGNKIIDVLIGQNAVAWITGGNHINIDYCITTQAGASGAATVVCILNNSPSATAWTGTVNFPGTATPVREWVTDTTPSSTTTGGNTQVTAAVAAGDVRVYAVG